MKPVCEEIETICNELLSESDKKRIYKALDMKMLKEREQIYEQVLKYVFDTLLDNAKVASVALVKDQFEKEKKKILALYDMPVNADLVGTDYEKQLKALQTEKA